LNISYIRPRNDQTEIYTCWPRRVQSMVSHVEYAPCALLRLEKDGTDRQTDARPFTLRLPFYAVIVITQRNVHVTTACILVCTNGENQVDRSKS